MNVRKPFSDHHGNNLCCWLISRLNVASDVLLAFRFVISDYFEEFCGISKSSCSAAIAELASYHGIGSSAVGLPAAG